MLIPRWSRPKVRILATFTSLIIANIAIWAWTLQALNGRPELLGTALLAYIFGLRHAFDPAIAAIDNVVRKLMRSKAGDHGRLLFRTRSFEHRDARFGRNFRDCLVGTDQRIRRIQPDPD